MKSDTAKPTADVTAAAQDQRREHTLKLPVVDASQGGVEKVAGDKVTLTDREAEVLRESGHIA